MRAFLTFLWTAFRDLWALGVEFWNSANNVVRWIVRIIVAPTALIMFAAMCGDYGAVWFIIIALPIVVAWLFLGVQLVVPPLGGVVWHGMLVLWRTGGRARTFLLIGLGAAAIIAGLLFWFGHGGWVVITLAIIVGTIREFRTLRIDILWPVILHQTRFRSLVGFLVGIFGLDLAIGLVLVWTRPERDWALAATFILLIVMLVSFMYAYSSTGTEAWDRLAGWTNTALIIVIILFLVGGRAAMAKRWNEVEHSVRKGRNHVIREAPEVAQAVPDFALGKNVLVDEDIQPGKTIGPYKWKNYGTMEPDVDPSFAPYLKLHYVDPMGKEDPNTSILASRRYGCKEFSVENTSTMPIHVRIVTTQF